MKKSNCISVAVLSLILLFALTSVHAQQVTPTSWNFGDVEVDNSVHTIIIVTNTDPFPVEITSIVLTLSSGGFSIVTTPTPPIILGNGESVEIEVVFTPTVIGEFSAQIVITNGEQFNVPLYGTGVAAQPPPASIQDILYFMDASVANGSLEGAGSGNSADGRLNALRNMLVEASNLLSAGNLGGACTQLSAALQRCNDFVQGTAQDDLKQMISELMSDLGC